MKLESVNKLLQFVVGILIGVGASQIMFAREVASNTVEMKAMKEIQKSDKTAMEARQKEDREANAKRDSDLSDLLTQVLKANNELIATIHAKERKAP